MPYTQYTTAVVVVGDDDFDDGGRVMVVVILFRVMVDGGFNYVYENGNHKGRYCPLCSRPRRKSFPAFAVHEQPAIWRIW